MVPSSRVRFTAEHMKHNFMKELEMWASAQRDGRPAERR